ncbi:hypothetical protein NBRGN_077_00050 [Nocardia brasiliensis NBRC 14402]|nr:hypothetical protein NBRGN_077_00050 [Nocardia brasiliensis NBRC 14402]
MQCRTGIRQTLELRPDVLVHRLVDECEHGADAVGAAVECGGQAPVGTGAADGENSARAAPMGFGQQPFQFADLVAAPSAVAVGAVVLAPQPNSGADVEGPDRGRGGTEAQIRQGVG